MTNRGGIMRWTIFDAAASGQPGHDRIAAGLAAADAMVDRITGSVLPIPTAPSG
jgi:hypothetical protein